MVVVLSQLSRCFLRGLATEAERSQPVTDSGRGEAATWRPLPSHVGLERETRLELATLCLGSRCSACSSPARPLWSPFCPQKIAYPYPAASCFCSSSGVTEPGGFPARASSFATRCTNRCVGAPALIVHGHIERQERAVNVVTERIEALPVAVDIPERTHSFR